MDIKRNNCKPCIVNRSDLATSDYDFMTKERIKEECVCVKKAACVRIAELLKDDHRPEADEILNNL